MFQLVCSIPLLLYYKSYWFLAGIVIAPVVGAIGGLDSNGQDLSKSVVRPLRERLKI